MRKRRVWIFLALGLLIIAGGWYGAVVGARRIHYYQTGTPSLCQAADRGDLPEVRRLLRLGVSPSREENDGEVYAAPLEHAIWGNHLPVVRYLCEHGAGRYNPRIGTDYLELAAVVGSPEVLGYLMQRFPRHSKAALLCCAAGDTYSAYYGLQGSWHLENVSYLLAHGAQAEINTPLPMGRRAIHLARTPAIAACLLAHGARLDVVDNIGATPLHVAAGRGDLPMVKFYLAHGLDINAQTTNGDSVLESAINSRNATVIAYLRAHGAKK